MSINWVMVPDDLSRPFIPLPRERILFTSPASTRTSFSLKTPKPPALLANSSSSASSSTSDPASVVDINIASGVAYLTTSRLIYLPRPATSTFKSFSAPLLNVGDTRVTAPFFGPNVLVGECKPVREGGIPPVEHAPYTVELRLTFKDGGAYDFHSRFCELRERLHQAREIAREIDGQNAAGTPREIHGEQLPAYESVDPANPSAPAAGQYTPPAPAPAPIPPAQTQQPQQRPAHQSGASPPDEPPPDYEEFAKS